MKNTVIINGVSLSETQLDILGKWLDAPRLSIVEMHVDSLETTKNTLIRLMCMSYDENTEFDKMIKEALQNILILQDDMKLLMPKI